MRIVSGLSAMAIFCVTYAMILPALTLEAAVACNMSEHRHGDECYSQVRTLICGMEESAPQEGHIHSDACYETISELTCAVPESEGHTHGEGCFDENGSLVCALPESEGHTHSDACRTEKRELVCGLEESLPTEGHVHTDACWKTEDVLICGLTEHTHDASCYIHGDPLADVETSAEWENDIAAGKAGDMPDAVAVARTQLGRGKSIYNYVQDVSGRRSGWNRFGAAFGDPYGEIGVMFVRFVFRYAGTELPAADTAAELASLVTMKDRPEMGDIVFLSDETGSIVSAGIFDGFTYENENEYTVIETLTGVVRETVYASGDPAVAGFGSPETETAPDIPGGTAASDEPALPYAPVMPETSESETVIAIETEVEAPEMPEAADETTAAEAVTADETTSAETTAEIEAVMAEDAETAAETSAAEETHAEIPAEPADETTAVAETETGTAESETAADETAPEETAAETAAVGTTEAETAEAETTAAETVIAETIAPDTTAPETTEAEPETAVPETDVPEEPEYAAALPAQKFEYRIGGVTVKAAADEGAFPEGTTMSAEEVTERSVIDAASDMVDGRIVGVRAYDIRFLDAEGAEIEPLIPIRVKILSNDPVESDTQTVVHVADDGSAEIVEQPDEFAVPMAAEEIVFDAGEFSVYAVVYSLKAVKSNGSKVTLKWTYNYSGYSKNVSINVNFIDLEGNPVEVNNNYDYNVESDEWVSFSGCRNIPTVEGYSYDHAVVKDLEVDGFICGSDDTIAYFCKDGKEVLQHDFWYDESIDINVYLKKNESGDNPSEGGDTSSGETPGGGTTGGNSSGGNGNTGESSSNDGASAAKSVTSNGDGTYTLTLSVKVPESGTASSSKANIVVIYDSSNSMNEAGSDNAHYVQDPNGSYLYDKNDDPIGGDLYEGYYPIGQAKYKATGKTVTFINIPDPNNPNVTNSKVIQLGFRTDDRYKLVPTRDDKAKECLEYLSEKLFAMNNGVTGDTGEVAFVEFGSTVFQTHSSTTAKTDFDGWVASCDNYAHKEANAAHVQGGTNWEAALNAANGISFKDNDPVYIVFISDGNPTLRNTVIAEDDGPRAGDHSHAEDVLERIYADEIIDGVYGTGNSDVKGYNFKAADDVAKTILSNGKTLYNIGIFGDADTMSSLSKSKYFDGTDEAGIRSAFDNIVGNISSSISYSDVSITDGITSLTTSTFIKGEPTAFSYFASKNGEPVAMSSGQMQAKYVTSSGNNNECGKIIWNLGEDKVVGGATYSLSTVIWPSQEAYDLVADLNNAKKTYDTLEQWQKDQVIKNDDGTYSLKTNTSVEATCTKKTETEGAAPVVESDQPITVIETLTPMPLEDSKITVEKEWEADLDHKQFVDMMNENPDYKAELTLVREDTEGNKEKYIEKIVIGAPDGDPVPTVWPDYIEGTSEIHWRYISAGLMVSEYNARQSGILDTIKSNPQKYPTKVFNEITYYILEPGHDCFFTEAPGSDYHFELEDKKWHPMVVDGKIKNVTFGAGNTVTAIDALNKLTAKNLLKGGIRIYKEVYDSEGNQIENDDTPFSVTVTMKNPDGTPYSIDPAKGGYRVVYGPNNPNKEEPEQDPEEASVTYKYGRSDRVGITGGTFTATIYTGDYIQVANVDRGVIYEVSETNIPYGYSLDEIVYSEDSQEMTSNTSHQVTVKNKKSDTFSFTKIWRDASCSTNTDWPPEAEITVTVRGEKEGASKEDNPKEDVPKEYMYIIHYSDLDDGNKIAAEDDEEKPKLMVKAADKSGYVFTLTGLPTGYTWSVSETPLANYQAPKYADENNHLANGAKDIGDGGIIYNDQIGAVLPSTGGSGRTAYYVIGLSLIALAAVFTPVIRKQRSE